MTHTETKQIEGGDLGPPGVLITFSCYTFTPQQRRRRLGLNDNTFPVIPSHIPRRSLSLWYLLLCVALSICSSSGTLYISLALGTSQAVFLIFINCFDKSGKNLHILFFSTIWYILYDLSRIAILLMRPTPCRSKQCCQELAIKVKVMNE